MVKKALELPMDTYCAPLLADIFLYTYFLFVWWFNATFNNISVI